jgi:ABC-type multidrug transport system ATPase subunit
MTSVVVEGVGCVSIGGSLVRVPELRARAPQLLRLTGPNGVGKSTVVELLGGSVVPRRGRVLIDGTIASGRLARLARTVTRSEPALLPAVSLERHARLFARAAGVGADHALAALAGAGLEGCLAVRADALSTGQRRSAWVVLTTLREAGVRILDEPFLGLDEEAACRLAVAIEAWASTGLVVLVDHGARSLEAETAVVRMEPA